MHAITSGVLKAAGPDLKGHSAARLRAAIWISAAVSKAEGRARRGYSDGAYLHARAHDERAISKWLDNAAVRGRYRI
ncbi:hypothetical protein HaLaN_05308 [Haematococcus lacustris]|uniref:Uncharacterized protein n=1 Tax=Haematococcus lacustris TaxID=44745 RepID=A0A699YKN2_HAELA|nr:hypothetical protein HaLaN_05308 [Haematococcus lacustris]